MSEKNESRIFLFFARFLIIAFWSAVLLWFLYLPKVFDFLWHDEKRINVIAFTELISSEALVRFKERTGIKVKITHVENDDELFSKLKISNGEGYDLAITTDHMVELLEQENLLQPLDRSYITHFEDIDKKLVGLYFDPHNKYSVPCAWIMHGIGYNKDYFKGKIDYISWDLVFKKSHSSGDYKIGMLNDMREAVFLASLYRFKKTFDLSDRKVQAVQDILIDQKRWVESYASDQVDYMLFTETVPLAIVPSSYMRIIFREQESDRFAFSIPEQGSLISIENCVISKASKKKEIANEFINFLISPEAVALNCNRYGLYPVNVKAYKFLDKDLFGRLGFPPSDEVIEKSDILKNDIPMRRLEDLWIAVKAS